MEDLKLEDMKALGLRIEKCIDEEPQFIDVRLRLTVDSLLLLLSNCLSEFTLDESNLSLCQDSSDCHLISSHLI
jgi:hypothetical protein